MTINPASDTVGDLIAVLQELDSSIHISESLKQLRVTDERGRRILRVEFCADDDVDCFIGDVSDKVILAELDERLDSSSYDAADVLAVIDKHICRKCKELNSSCSCEESNTP
jgi:hypothetical protein